VDPYLVEIARRADHLDDAGEVQQAMDKLEFLYEALDPDQQDLASELLARLARRLEALRARR
jgi:hypothetical protein